MPAMLFDLDGVLYEGERLIAGAADAVAFFRQRQIPHLFLTNTTSRPRSALVDKLAGFGIACHIEDFLTPPVAACQWLRQHRRQRLALFAPEATTTEFSDFELVTDNGRANTHVDAVVVGDLGEAWNFATMNHIFRLLMDNPQAVLLALGMTRYWRRGDGLLQLDVGPMIKAFEYASGRKAVVTGKPAAGFFQAAHELLGEDRLVMIGDDIHGDIEAAQLAGLEALLVRTGKFQQSDLATGIRPDAVLDSIAQLPDWWRQRFKAS